MTAHLPDHRPDRPADDRDDRITPAELPETLQKIRSRTPARIFEGRAGAAYRTNVQLELRRAHASARDAVRGELDLFGSLGEEFAHRWKLFEVQTQAAGKEEYLLRPDLGRRFTENSRKQIQERCPPASDVQIIIGDGLSVPAVSAQVPALLPLLIEGLQSRGWKVGQPFVVRYCRVGILNEIGELLDPRVAVLLIGERPGLATAESLSAYMAYRPRPGHSDSDRNLISNIHARGASTADAAPRILNLAAQMMAAGASGYTLKETTHRQPVRLLPRSKRSAGVFSPAAFASSVAPRPGTAAPRLVWFRSGRLAF